MIKRLAGPPLPDRLRQQCNCPLDNPCAAELECQDSREAADRIEALEAQIARLREALHPFRIAPLAPGDLRYALVKSEHILAARAALAEGGDND